MNPFESVCSTTVTDLTGSDIRLEIGRELARGSTCSIRAASAEGSPVAAKVLLPSLIGTATMERFMRESDLLCRMSHPNIVSGIAVGSIKAAVGSAKTPTASPWPAGCPLLVMELVKGPNLADLIQEKKPDAIGAERALRIASGIACALGYLYMDGRVHAHRDVKPSNILIASDWTPKLADLGIAKTAMMVSDEVETRLAGTVGYMSPEQLADSSKVDIRSDIYSLGVVLAEMLGIRAEKDPRKVLARRMAGKIPTIGAADARRLGFGRNEAAAISQVLERMCAYEPYDRYQVPHDLARDLGRCADMIAAGKSKSQERLGHKDERSRRSSRGARSGNGRLGRAERKSEQKGRKHNEERLPGRFEHDSARSDRSYRAERVGRAGGRSGMAGHGAAQTRRKTRRPGQSGRADDRPKQGRRRTGRLGRARWAAIVSICSALTILMTAWACTAKIAELTPRHEPLSTPAESEIVLDQP